MNNSPTCERASDLIAFLYNEATESEARDFKLHLKECAGCRQEVASFGLVRESITAWRDEALSGFVSRSLAATARRKSAIAALREFLDLSPLWLKAATGFAVVAFCVLAALVFVNLNRTRRVQSESVAGTYTQADVDRIVKEALAKQESTKQPEPVQKSIAVAEAPKPQQVPSRQSQFAKSRRPLTRAEREQLAADLRLLATDEAGLNLLGDRINQ